MQYRLLRKIHFYTALVLAIPLTVLSITGTLLVYGPEIQRMLSPDAWMVKPVGEMLPLEEVLHNVEMQRPDLRVWSFSVTQEPDIPHSAWLAAGAGQINVDPYTGEILLHYKQGDTFESWVIALHRRWLTSGDTAYWVRHGVSAVALLLICELIFGFWLWLKPAKPFKRLKVKSSYRIQLKILRIHQFTGVITGLFLLTIAFTGLAMYWTPPAKYIVGALMPGDIEQPTPPKVETLPKLSASITDALELAQKVMPEGKLRHMRPPESANGIAMFTFFGEGDTVPTQVWVGDHPPRVLYHHDGRQANAATWLWHLKYYIHIGDFAGPLVRALWVLIALMPTAFVFTGIWMHLRRKNLRDTCKKR